MSDNPTVTDPSLDEAPQEWDEEGELPDGTPVAKKGALWYIVDEDGEPLSDGYHEIRITNQGWVGKRGASQEVIEL